MDKQLLEILVCPTTGASLSWAPSADVEAANAAVDAGTLTYVDGRAVESHIDALLVTRDRSTGYRVDDGIPIMLAERGISLPTQP